MFIVFEGLDGCGKTTIMKEVGKKLEEMGIDVKLTREPGGCKFGEELRKIRNDYNLEPKSEALLYISSMYQNVSTEIFNHLITGGVVLCDRYIPSTLVYQGHLKNILPFIKLISRETLKGFLNPELYIKINVDKDTLKERMNARLESNSDTGKLAEYDDIVLRKYNIINKYYDEVRKDLPNVVNVSNNGCLEEVVDKVVEIIIKNKKEKEKLLNGSVCLKACNNYYIKSSYFFYSDENYSSIVKLDDGVYYKKYNGDWLSLVSKDTLKEIDTDEILDGIIFKNYKEAKDYVSNLIEE